MVVTRRELLRYGLVAGSGAGIAASGVSVADVLDDDSGWSLDLLGHSVLSNRPGGYTQISIRDDGQYAVLGAKFEDAGSYLVDLTDPSAPSERHWLPASSSEHNQDVKFDPREEVYYRVQETGGNDGIEIVDYGYGDGTPDDPTIVGKLDAGQTHNCYPHHDEPLLYSTNFDDAETPGMDVWDVSDLSAPERIGQAGPDGALHDLVYDPVRELIHCAYMGGAFSGYAICDASDPREPTMIGDFDYDEHADYKEVGFGNQGFEACHYVDYDPNRALVVVGDETHSSIPGGKHVFDIGWEEGSPEEPIPIGFTLSPNAQTVGNDEKNPWTGHSFDFVPRDGATLLASGDYSEGAVLYDLTDPTDPQAVDRYETDDGADEANGPDDLPGPPRAWNADFSASRDLLVVSDMFTGIYVFEVTGSGATDDDESAD